MLLCKDAGIFEVCIRRSPNTYAEGILAVFMKGQTTALRYPNPLHRTPGDIDFVISAEDFDKTMEVMVSKVTRFFWKKAKEG